MLPDFFTDLARIFSNRGAAPPPPGPFAYAWNYGRLLPTIKDIQYVGL